MAGGGASLADRRQGTAVTRRLRLGHARIWTLLALLLPAILLAALTLRSGGPGERPAVLLEAPPP